MPERSAKTEPFQSGQQTNARDKSEKMTLRYKVSKDRNIGQPDPLRQALTKPPPLMPSDTHPFGHSKVSKSKGASYNPAGEYGRPRGSFGSKATGMGSHTSRPGSNAVGNNSNRTGQKSGYPSFKPSGGGKKS